MTELEKKAKEYSDKTEFTEYDNSSLSESLDISEEIKQAYIAGAKENQPNAEEMIKRLLKGGYITTGISDVKENLVFHNLIKNPNELPKMGVSGMREFTSEEIKNRLSNIGAAIGTISLEYIAKLEEENEQLKKDIIEIEKVSDFRWEENQRLKAQIEKMKNHQNCKHRKTWGTADIMEDELKSPCDKCKDYDNWELAE